VDGADVSLDGPGVAVGDVAHLVRVGWCLALRRAYGAARVHADGVAGAAAAGADATLPVEAHVTLHALVFLRRTAVLLAAILPPPPPPDGGGGGGGCGKASALLPLDAEELGRLATHPVAIDLAAGGDTPAWAACVAECRRLARALRLPLPPSLDPTAGGGGGWAALRVTGGGGDGSDFARPRAHVGAVPRRLGLTPLPRLFQTLLEAYDSRPCDACGLPPRPPGGALCLLCRQYVCAAGPCGGRAHVRSCGAGVGVLLVLKITAVIVVRDERRGLWGSPYLDEFGEEDTDLRRGKPLYLSPHRVAALERLWLRHGFDHDSRLLAASLIIRSEQLLDI